MAMRADEPPGFWLFMVGLLLLMLVTAASTSTPDFILVVCLVSVTFIGWLLWSLAIFIGLRPPHEGQCDAEDPYGDMCLSRVPLRRNICPKCGAKWTPVFISYVPRIAYEVGGFLAFVGLFGTPGVFALGVLVVLVGVFLGGAPPFGKRGEWKRRRRRKRLVNRGRTLEKLREERDAEIKLEIAKLQKETSRGPSIRFR
jgi:hypothetical protein